MVPADQGLRTDEVPGPEVDDRLVLEDELGLVDGASQLQLQLEPSLHRLVHLRLEDDRPVAARVPRDGPRHVGPPQQRARLGVARDGRAEANARRHVRGEAADLNRLPDRREDPLRKRHPVVERGVAIQQDPELVAAEAAARVGRGDARSQAAADLLEDLVPGVVPEAVVHPLETIEPNREDRGVSVRRRRARQGLADAIPEEGAVGEVRQEVVQRHLGELPLERLALPDVTRRQHDLADRGVCEKVRGNGLHLAPDAGPIPQSPLERRRDGAPGRHVRDELPHARSVVGVHEPGDRAAHKLGDVDAEDSPHLRRGVGHDTLSIDKHDGVRRIRRQGPESLLGHQAGVVREQSAVLAKHELLADQDDGGQYHRAVQDLDELAGDLANGQRDEHPVAGGEGHIGERQQPAAEGRPGPVGRRCGMGLEVPGERDQERRAEVDDVGPALEAERPGQVELAVPDVGHEHQAEAADERDEGPDVDLGRVPEGGRGDAEQEHEVADRVAEGERRAHGVRVQRRQDGPEERVPDHDPTTDHDDEGVDREPQRVAPGRRGALEHEEGGHNGRVVEDVGGVRDGRGRRAPAREVQPRPGPVAHGIDEHRDSHDDPAAADPRDLDPHPGPKDERGRQQVQSGLAEIGDHAPGAGIAKAQGEPRGGDDPAERGEGDEEPVELKTAAASEPVEHGTRGPRHPRSPRQPDGPA